MQVKTSVTLSSDVLRAMEQVADQYKNRSEFLETAAWVLLAQVQPAKRNAKDLAILNKQAARLNREAKDVLAYQVPDRETRRDRPSPSVALVLGVRVFRSASLHPVDAANAERIGNGRSPSRSGRRKAGN